MTTIKVGAPIRSGVLVSRKVLGDGAGGVLAFITKLYSKSLSATRALLLAESEAGFTLFADLPGVSKEDLTVRVDGDTLVIEGILTAPTPERMDLIYGEAQFSAYRRQFTLSRELDCSKIEANLKNGVLKLTIPKTEEAKPRRINVALS